MLKKSIQVDVVGQFIILMGILIGVLAFFSYFYLLKLPFVTSNIMIILFLYLFVFNKIIFSVYRFNEKHLLYKSKNNTLRRKDFRDIVKSIREELSGDREHHQVNIILWKISKKELEYKVVVDLNPFGEKNQEQLINNIKSRIEHRVKQSTGFDVTGIDFHFTCTHYTEYM